MNKVDMLAMNIWYGISGLKTETREWTDFKINDPEKYNELTNKAKEMLSVHAPQSPQDGAKVSHHSSLDWLD